MIIELIINFLKVSLILLFASSCFLIMCFFNYHLFSYLIKLYLNWENHIIRKDIFYYLKNSKQIREIIKNDKYFKNRK